MNPLARQIQEEIRRDGPISFARFMELALYAPGLGYYEQPREIGRRGDFFTSVSVGPVFGELLAFQFAQWLEEGKAERCQIIEAGAHDGKLAADILGWMQKWRPELFPRLEYILIEPSHTRRNWQEQTLREFSRQTKWTGRVAELVSPVEGNRPATTDVGRVPPHGAHPFRIIFSNELLDAMPVHRFSWDGENWRECVVACENEKFVWQLASATSALTNALPKIGSELAAAMPKGFIVEHSPAAVAWWTKAAEVLGRGKLLAIDYGLTEVELLRPERSKGTLRAFSKHHSDANLLDNPGEGDITAHVNFSAIETAGLSAGLTTERFMDQEKFLVQILGKTHAAQNSFEAWTPARIKQFHTLAHPEHLGRAFRVLVQTKNEQCS